MSSLQKVRSVHQEKNAKYLIIEGLRYFIWTWIPLNIIWQILPEAKTKHLIARSKLLTTIFFYLRGSFYYEQKSVLEGQASYQKFEEMRENPQHRIIRNIHRIEKGLSMRDRRSVFAKGYITDVVQDVIAAYDNETELEENQIHWGIDVLAEYFKVVDSVGVISQQQKQFDDFLKRIDYEPGDKIPKSRQELHRDVPSYNELRHLAKQRRSTRWFQDRSIPRELVDNALQLALESPSACNRQSYEFLFFDDRDMIDEVTDLSIGVSGYQDNIPFLAVIVGKQRAYSSDRDRHLIYIDASLAAMAFQFGLESLGLASCCINWPAIPRNDWEIADRLNLASDEEVIMLMAIGYPDPEGKIPHSAKKDVKNIRSYNLID